jgi:hypothetical protein
VGDDAFADVAKEQASERHTFGLAGGWGEGVLTRTHGKKESADDNVGFMVVLVGTDDAAMGELEQPTEEARGDGFLATRGRVHIVESFQEGAESGPELGAVRDVNGAPLETAPERQSQVACGTAQS